MTRILATAMVLKMWVVLLSAGGRDASAQDHPQIHTPIGAFTITSVVLADEFPVGCTPPAHIGAATCVRPTRGNRFLIIHIRNPSADLDSDFADPIDEDMKAVKLVALDGGTWSLGVRQWRTGDGIHLVFAGKGSPDSVVLNWPGNQPITLRPGGD